MIGRAAAPGIPSKMSLHVVHVITGLSRGGAETALHRLVHGLSREAGFTHSIVSLTVDNQFDFEPLGVAVRTLGMRRGLPTPAALWRLRRMVSELEPDIVQGWMYHGNVAATLAMKPAAAVPVIWNIRHSLHDLVREKPLTRLLIRVGAVLARRTTVRRIVYCSDTSRVQHERVGYPHSKSVHIPNGFDCQRFRPSPDGRYRVRRSLGLEDDAVVVGSVARFHPIKNHVGLIAAFSRIAPRYPRARLLLAGFGISVENEAITEAIRRGGQQDRIILLGERNDMPDLFAALDVLVLGSRSEGFPNVLGEAMACGVPCVTTDVGDAASIVGDTGFVAAANDEAGLAEALGRSLALPDEERVALGARARSRVRQFYHMPEVIGRYAELYRHTSGSSAGGDAHAMNDAQLH